MFVGNFHICSVDDNSPKFYIQTNVESGALKLKKFGSRCFITGTKFGRRRSTPETEFGYFQQFGTEFGNCHPIQCLKCWVVESLCG